jgi:hypothetical protein
MVGDFYQDRLPQKPYWDRIEKFMQPEIKTIYPMPEVSREEFEDLKKTVEDMKQLLQKAKEYDERTGQPDCKNEDKIALIKKVAELVGVDINI